MKNNLLLASIIFVTSTITINAQSYLRVPGDFATIQEAVDAAASYDIIIVDPGTFVAPGAPFAVVDKPMTIMGGGSEGTYATILDGGSYGAGIDNSCPSTTWPRAFDIHSSEVTIQGFQIRNFMGLQSGADWGVAIMARGDCHTPAITLTDIFVENVATVDCRLAINFNQVDNSVVDHLDVTYDLGAPDDYAICVKHSDNVEIVKCTLDTSGIWMGPGCDFARVTNNRVDDSPSHGIWVGSHEDASGPISDTPYISGNRVTRSNGGGIVLANNPAGTVTDATLRSNVVRRTKGGPMDLGGFTIMGGTYEGLKMTSNDSRQSNGNQPGLLLANCTVGSSRVDRNRFAANGGPGVSLDNVSRGNGDLIIVYNSIYANAGNQIEISNEDAGTGQLNATSNWWGDWTGPYHPILNPNGLGDPVGDNIFFDDWLWVNSYRAPYISSSGMEAGTTGRIHAKYCSPHSPVQMIFSTLGGGPTISYMGTMYLTSPYEMLPKVWTDHKGNAQNDFHLPMSMQGMDLWFQAYDFKQERLSNGHHVVVR